MKYRYTAKLYLVDGQIIENHSNDLEHLMGWMTEQAEASYDEVTGDIVDNHSHQIIKNMQYCPPN